MGTRKILIGGVVIIAGLTSLAVVLMPGPPPPLPACLQAARVARFAQSRVENPVAGRPDPYAYYALHPDDLAPPPPAAVCAVKFLDPAHTRYQLRDFETAAAAAAAAAFVTHTGRCGTCSTLQDLAVYLSRPDLTAPVRQCGMLASLRPISMMCLEKLGFSPACAATWYANARHTGQVCLAVCLKSWLAGEGSNTASGGLNACLACDETRSGPVFKREAGRTRRNSGLQSSIGREPGEISAVVHDY